MRPATPADTDAILVLMGAFYREEGLALHPAADAALATLLADPRLGFVILAEHGSKVAGYVVLTYGFSLELGGRDAFVDELFVAPARRRVGLGEGLLRAALVRGRAEGASQVLLEVAAPDAGKLALYERVGFTPRPHPLMICPLR